MTVLDRVWSADALWETHIYLAPGLPLHAHEVFEQRWRCCPEHERDLWRRLALWAAGLTHGARGNPIGATRLEQRGIATMARQRADSPFAQAVDALIAEFGS